MRFEDYRVTPEPIPNGGTMFVDHSVNHRGGHLGHALEQCENGDVLAFYPNCDAGNRVCGILQQSCDQSAGYGKRNTAFVY